MFLCLCHLVRRKWKCKGGNHVHWIDTDTRSRVTPKYRSRLVGREINVKKRLDDLFSGTPPLETLSLLVAECAQVRQRAEHSFYGPATRPLYEETPEGDRGQGAGERGGRLELSFYGTRGAAQHWARGYSRVLTELGFRQGLASPRNFQHQSGDQEGGPPYMQEDVLVWCERCKMVTKVIFRLY